jgi:hypothetical protein
MCALEKKLEYARIKNQEEFFHEGMHFGIHVDDFIEEKVVLNPQHIVAKELAKGGANRHDQSLHDLPVVSH